MRLKTGPSIEFASIKFQISRSSRPEVFCKKSVLRNFGKFTGKHLPQGLVFNKVEGLRPAALLQKRLWHRYFPVNFAEFLRTLFLTEHLWWLLLDKTSVYFYFNNYYFIGACHFSVITSVLHIWYEQQVLVNLLIFSAAVLFKVLTS